MLLLAPLGALAQSAASRIFTFGDAQKFTEQGDHKLADTRARLATLSKPEIVTALKDALSNKTKIIFQKDYGVYVEYSGADGSDRMWFPGNHGVVRGKWFIKDSLLGTRACFQYFKGTAGEEVDNEQCPNPAQTISGSDVIDEKSEDVFDLMSNQIPHVKTEAEIPAWPAGKEAPPASQ